MFLVHQALHLDFAHTAEAWLSGGVRRTLAKVLKARALAFEESTALVAHKLSELMRRVLTAAGSAAKFLNQRKAATGTSSVTVGASSSGGGGDATTPPPLRPLVEAASPSSSSLSSKKGAYSASLFAVKGCTVDRLLAAALKHPMTAIGNPAAAAAAAATQQRSGGNGESNQKEEEVKGARSEAAAAAAAGSVVTSSAFLEDYYRTLEATRQGSLSELKRAVGSVAMVAAKTLTSRLASLLRSCARDLTLHVASCRVVLEDIKTLDMRHRHTALEATQVLRRKCARLLARLAAAPSVAAAKSQRKRGGNIFAGGGSKEDVKENEEDDEEAGDEEDDGHQEVDADEEEAAARRAASAFIASGHRFAFESAVARRFPHLAHLMEGPEEVETGSGGGVGETRLVAAAAASLLKKQGSKRKGSGGGSGSGGGASLEVIGEALRALATVKPLTDPNYLPRACRLLGGDDDEDDEVATAAAGANGGSGADVYGGVTAAAAAAAAAFAAASRSVGDDDDDDDTEEASASSATLNRPWAAALAHLSNIMFASVDESVVVMARTQGLTKARQVAATAVSSALSRPSMLPGGFHATCLHLWCPSVDDPCVLFTKEEALHRLPPAYAIFRVRIFISFMLFTRLGEHGADSLMSLVSLLCLSLYLAPSCHLQHLLTEPNRFFDPSNFFV
jgi:hypothetical protein